LVFMLRADPLDNLKKASHDNSVTVAVS